MSSLLEPICKSCLIQQHAQPDWPPMPVLYTCALCAADLCGLHSESLRLLPGVVCTDCAARSWCETCIRHAACDEPTWHVRRARNTCLHCQRPVCGVHTHWFHGRVSCGCCAHSLAGLTREEPTP